MSKITQPPWSLSFGQVEAALGDLLDIKRSRQSSLQFRLKNLFKVGFLPHVPAGRGKAARYGAGEVFQLAFAIELMQFDLGPHRIVSKMARLESVIVSAAAEAGEYLANGMQPLNFDRHLYVSFDPGGLSDLAREPGEPPPEAERIYHGEQPHEDKISRRLAIINMTRLSVDLALSLGRNNLCAEEEFGGLLIDWAVAQKANGGGRDLNS